MAAAPPLGGLRLVSLGSYFSTLQPQGAFSYERTIIAAADRYGLTAVLPLAVFLPQKWRRDDDVRWAAKRRARSKCPCSVHCCLGMPPARMRRCIGLCMSTFRTLQPVSFQGFPLSACPNA